MFLASAVLTPRLSPDRGVHLCGQASRDLNKGNSRI